MILCDKDIMRAIEGGQFFIDPPPRPEDYDTTSVNLHLSDEFREWDFKKVEEAFGHAGVSVDLNSYNFTKLAGEFLKGVSRDADESIVLKPKQFILSTTMETVGNEDPACCPAARIEGRSSLARLGLQIHMTAPTIHAGFKGKITLEIFNAGPFILRLRPGISICQLIIEQVSSPPKGSMQGKRFQGQDSARGGRCN